MAKKVYSIISGVLGDYLLGTFFILESIIFFNFEVKRMKRFLDFKVSMKSVKTPNELFITRLILISFEYPPLIPFVISI